MTSLLLLFSAMMSALVGVGAGGRVAQAPVAVASLAVEQVAPVTARNISERPLAAIAGILAFLFLGGIVLTVAPATIPAWKTRRRE